MTEQELKEKIVEILRYHRDDFIEENYRRDIERIDFDALADALILEGIGDVSEWKHRAEVAERALKLDCYDKARTCYPNCGRERIRNVFYEEYIKQAEKELAEERKNYG